MYRRHRRRTPGATGIIRRSSALSAPARPASPTCQALEARTLLAGEPVSFFGTGGDDIIQIWVAGTDIAVKVNGSTSFAPIASTSALLVQAGSGDDEILLESTDLPVTVLGEAGRDDLILAQTGGDLDTLTQPVHFDGGGDRDEITVWDDLRAAGSDDTYILESESIDRAGAFAGATFTAIERLDVRAGVADNTFIVNSTPAEIPDYDLYGWFGNDTFHIGAGPSGLAALLGPVEIHGEEDTDTVVVHDRTHVADAAWTITSLTAARTGWAGIRYNTSEQLTIDAGSGNDSFAVNSTHAETPLIINAGDGDDAASLAPLSQLLDDIVRPVTVNGEAGYDQLVLFDQANAFDDTYIVTSTDVTRDFFGGTAYGTLEGVTLNTGSGQDTVNVDSTASGAPVTLNTAGGVDAINVARTAFGAPVRANTGDGLDVVRADGVAGAVASVAFTHDDTLGELILGQDGTASLAAGVALTTGSVSLGATATLDLGDGTLIVDYAGVSPFDSIGAALANNRIHSSVAAVTPDHVVGMAEATDLFGTFPAMFAGQSVDDTAVLLRYTRNGDANLDQEVDLADFNRLAANFGRTGAWAQGNFNFSVDSVIDLLDFNVLAANFGQSAQMAGAASTGAPSPLGKPQNDRRSADADDGDLLV